MATGEDRAKDQFDRDSAGALSVRLIGVRFDRGRVPIRALDTLKDLDALVRAISKDIEFSLWTGTQRSPLRGTVELALVGEVKRGSSVLELLFVPSSIAEDGRASVLQQDLLHALPEAVPATIDAVYSGTDLPFPASERTIDLVGRVGAKLHAQEQMVIRPLLHNIAKEELSVTVTRERSDAVRSERAVRRLNDFFVTGTIRELKNQGKDPGTLSVRTDIGPFRIPSVDTEIMSRAAGLLSTDPTGVVAISGTGEFDGKGRLKQLTHLTDLKRIDRFFNPERRLRELAELSSCVSRGLATTRPLIENLALTTGRAPGLFLDEDDDLEARWIIHRSEDRPALVVSATFGGDEVYIYAYDRASDQVIFDQFARMDPDSSGRAIKEAISLAVAQANGG